MSHKLCNNCVHLRKLKKTHFYICHNPKSKFFKTEFPHGKTRKACSLCKLREAPIVPQIIPEGMRLIEDFRSKEEFRDSKFWIIGSDANLDFYPDNFFDGKFSIAVNLSCVAFPESTYLYMSGREELEWIISKYPDYLKKVILPLGHVLPSKRGVGLWENWGLEPIYMKPENKPMLKSVPDYESGVKRILSNGPGEFILVRTSAHWAIFAAAVLGAKKIILVGCSHKSQKGQIYAHKRGMSDFVSEAVEKAHRIVHYGSQRSGIERVRRDTIQLARIFKKHGIEIIRHRYDEEKREFIFEEI